MCIIFEEIKLVILFCMPENKCYFKKKTGRPGLRRGGVVSRESGAPADQVEETPGRASLEKMGCRTPPQLHAGGVGRQQQQVLLYITLCINM